MEETRPPDTRDLLRAVLDHPDFVRVWEDSEGIDRYLFVSDDDTSYSAHGLVAAHEWTVNHPFVRSFPDAPMITRLRRTEKLAPDPGPGWNPRGDPQMQDRVTRIKESYPFPWELPDV